MQDRRRQHVEVTFASPVWKRAIVRAASWCERAVAAALEASSHPLPEVEVAILLTDDEAVRRLNRDWRGIDRPTNVLSFPSHGPNQLAQLWGMTGPVPLGDVVLAVETLLREAAAEQRPPEHHLAHLVVHGSLHLLSFDHETDAEAEIMEALETRILAGLGVPDPYRSLEISS